MQSCVLFIDPKAKISNCRIIPTPQSSCSGSSLFLLLEQQIKQYLVNMVFDGKHLKTAIGKCTRYKICVSQSSKYRHHYYYRGISVFDSSFLDAQLYKEPFIFLHCDSHFCVDFQFGVLSSQINLPNFYLLLELDVQAQEAIDQRIQNEKHNQLLRQLTYLNPGFSQSFGNSHGK